MPTTTGAASRCPTRPCAGCPPRAPPAARRRAWPCSEHVMARCGATWPSRTRRRRPSRPRCAEAAATLKLAQMAPLYATREAVAYDEPERSGCLARRRRRPSSGVLVTRPCAVVRGASGLRPVDAGIARVASDRRAESVLGDAAEAKVAKTKYHEATLRATHAGAGRRPRHQRLRGAARRGSSSLRPVGTSATGARRSRKTWR